MIGRTVSMFVVVCACVILFHAVSGCGTSQGASSSSFTFTVTADIEGAAFTAPDELRLLFRDIKDTGGPGAFMIHVGDHMPGIEAQDIELKKAFGADFPWYCVLGNNDQKEPEKSMRFIRSHLRELPYIVNVGPFNSETTTYSFDYGDAHFVVLNLYYDGCTDHGTRRPGTAGKVIPQLYYWLADDLAATDKKWIFVAAHEPAFPQPDADWGDVRHENDSLNEYPAQRDALWELLSDHRVVAYFNGHIHRYARYLKDGVWQVSVAQSRGNSKYDSYVRVHVGRSEVTFDVYRPLHEGVFRKTDTWEVTRPDGPTAFPHAMADPDAAWVGIEYVKQLSLTQRCPATDWSVIEGPPGLTVDRHGFVRGWTPTAQHVGSDRSITVRAANTRGVAEVTWPVRVSPLPADTVAMFPFNTGPEGWRLETWMGGKYGPASISWQVLGGHPGGTVFSVGHGANDDNRCTREGTILTRAISTRGFRDIRVEFDVIGDLAAPPCGQTDGVEGGVDGSSEDQLGVCYSTTGPEGPWTTARVFKAGDLPAEWTRKVVDLSTAQGTADNPDFALRLVWQFNTFSDSGRIDNVAVLGAR
ncbi:MAG TPA: metallophosphoesterase [Phycisphaerae bacterium]|nr:metallophosphoesterase [Phycisphaerae bacterium]HRR83543.1 metallophosphoesterase [Phycisphaerae bacterium]